MSTEFDVNDLDCKIILIDTNAYAGNFERELCAYVTGHLRDCKVGKEIAEKAINEIIHKEWWEDNISYQEEGQGSEFFTPCKNWA